METIERLQQARQKEEEDVSVTENPELNYHLIEPAGAHSVLDRLPLLLLRISLCICIKDNNEKVDGRKYEQRYRAAVLNDKEIVASRFLANRQNRKAALHLARTKGHPKE
jgi:hypothetical protein